MGYAPENSYTNSNNGGSVNSQDSIWQLKMSAAQAAAAAAAAGGGNNTGTLMSNQHQTAASIAAGMSSYGGYDPLAAHASYGTVEDYASYPHLATTPGIEDEYQHTLRQSQNPSRQADYCGGDSYASVHKPKKRLDQPHLDSSSYHDVSGLPDPYLEHQLHLHQQQQQQDQEDSKSLLQQQQHHQQAVAQQAAQQALQQQQMSLNYDESLESGYSTPNSRNRRVIREIIV